MPKRSNFPRRAQDAYFTPVEPVHELARHVPRGASFIEPCAGDGRLVRHLEAVCGLICVAAFDLCPAGPGVAQGDALTVDLPEADYIITNPPWTRALMHPLITRFAAHAPTWLLFDSGWWQTRQAVPSEPILRTVQGVGRVSWMENGQSGMDDAAWHLFDARGPGSAGFQAHMPRGRG
jgi:hypothetical protein